MAKHWIAGDHIDDAIKRASDANIQGFGTILNFLGEHQTDPKKIQDTVVEYIRLMAEIDSRKLDSSISIKPTQMGLILDEELCEFNIAKTVEQATSMGIFTWLDMEGSGYTQATLDIYNVLHEKFEDTGIVIQANLKRSMTDLEQLLEEGGRIRLVKGGYDESPEISFKTRDKVDSNYASLLTTLFERGGNFAVATHDDKLIQLAEQLNHSHPRNFEFQFLLGVRRELKRKLHEKGFTVKEYIPYGKDWLPYSIRRIREKKSNVLLLLRSLLQG